MLDDEKPIEQFLTLKERMEVALLVSDEAGSQYAGLGVIDKCSPRGVMCRFLVLHTFFVVVNVTKVNTKYNGQTAYYKEEIIKILGVAINHRVLWSKYKVRRMEPLCPSRDHIVKQEDMASLPRQFQLEKEDNNFSTSDINTTYFENELGGQGIKA